MVQVDLITGFLGAGKTTFLRRYVRYLVAQGHNVCILENDFGAVNVDAMLVQDLLGPNCDLETISGGCDCDTHQRRMRTKLIAMAMRGFDRVVVEPSGIFDVDEFFDVLRDDPLDRWYRIGNVIAIVGGLGEKNKSLSLNRAYSVTRQTGSTIKPIGAYALGVEYGLVNWSTMLNNSPLYQKQDMVIRDEDYCRKNGLMGLSDKQLRAYPNAWRSWPRNYGGNYGDNSDVPLWNGLARSLNTIAVRVGDLVGASNIFNFVYNTLQLNTLDPVNDVGLAQMVMGSQTHGVTPTALAAAFQIFYDGQYTTPHLYTRVLDRDGNIYLENNSTSYQALTPDTAYVMNRLLKNVLYSSVGTAGGRYPNSNGMEAFGKTGTASDEKDLWFVGGTPYYVTAVWWGYDAPYDMTKTLGKQQAKTRTCVMAWKALMEQVQADLPYKAFPTSAGVVERRYCTQSGLLAGGSCPSTAVGYYRADDLPGTCNYSHAAAPAAAAPAETAAPEQAVIPADTGNQDTD